MLRIQTSIDTKNQTNVSDHLTAHDYIHYSRSDNYNQYHAVIWLLLLIRYHMDTKSLTTNGPLF